MFASIVIRDGTFNAMHWIFSLKYWIISREIPNMFSPEPLEKDSKWYTVAFYVGILLNVGPVFGLNFSDFSYDGHAYLHNTICYYGIYLVVFISASFLLFALIKIR